MDMKNDVICWWSGGVTSAVAGALAIEFFGLERCRFIFIDTKNEDKDTYRFKKDCERFYGKNIEVLSAINDDKTTGRSYDSIESVWRHYKSLNVATGAVCSTDLKRKVRIWFQQNNDFRYQVFGYEFKKKEMNRALSMTMNNPDSKSIYPLLMMAYNKKDCIDYLQGNGIDPPLSYQMGFVNNNCLGTGCVQGGIGYWKHMKELFPGKFDKMAQMEHELTNEKGKPVTMLKDQSKEAKASGITLVFLKKHPDYPEYKCIDDMPHRKMENLMECNGFCGTDDLNDNKAAEQLNFSFDDI